MALLIVRDQSKWTSRAALRLILEQNSAQDVDAPPVIELGDATSLLVVTWPRTPYYAAASRLLVRQSEAHDESVQPEEPESQGGVNRRLQTWRYRRWSQLYQNTAQDDTEFQLGDATALHVQVWRPTLRRWPGLYFHPAADDSSAGAPEPDTAAWAPLRFHPARYRRWVDLYRNLPGDDSEIFDGGSGGFTLQWDVWTRPRGANLLYFHGAQDDSAPAAPELGDGGSLHVQVWRAGRFTRWRGLLAHTAQDDSSAGVPEPDSAIWAPLRFHPPRYRRWLALYQHTAQDDLIPEPEAMGWAPLRFRAAHYRRWLDLYRNTAQDDSTVIGPEPDTAMAPLLRYHRARLRAWIGLLRATAQDVDGPAPPVGTGIYKPVFRPRRR